MQKFISLLLILLFSTTILAQNAKEDISPWKKSMFISLAISPGFIATGNKPPMLIQYINPKFGYFLTDNLAVGLSAQYKGYFIPDQQTHAFAAGPFARYYFLNAEKWGAYLEAGYLYGRYYSQIESFNDYRIREIYGGMGIEYRFNEKLSLDFMISYQRNLLKKNGQFVPMFGVKWKF